jgi:UDP-N-acetylglucosamine--N-acetylmuramyl-(pentapeptide) pyrophosphoryl-undecaprenol N-acetylglucosamine transferase
MNNGTIIQNIHDLKTTGTGKRVIIAGGGTGGHIFPAVAIANALKDLDNSIEILFVGARGKMEMERVPAEGYNIMGLNIAGYNRSSILKNLLLPFKILDSFNQVRKILKHFRPHAVIGVGGYSSFPVLRAAQAQGIPTFIHESNSFAGKSNRMVGRKARKIFVATDGMSQFFPADKIMVTGNPVRQSLVDTTVIRAEAVEYFGLDRHRKTVLVVGGSLGAKSINEAIEQHLNDFKKEDVQLIWQTGKSFAPKAAKEEINNSSIWTNSFITRMDYAYIAADVVVSRAGAMAVSELCIAAKPVVFVPYPFAAEDHQTVNAMHLVNKEAALMIKDSEVSGRLFDTVRTLIRDEALARKLRTNIGKLAKLHADKIIAEEVLKSI